MAGTGLDQGLLVLMIEMPIRTHLVASRESKVVRKGLRRAGFRGGWLSSMNRHRPGPPHSTRQRSREAHLQLRHCGHRGWSCWLAAARLAACAGKRVVLFEGQRLGGTSLNSGSVPSKALIRSATLFAAVRETSRLLGSEAPSPVADLGRLATRLRRTEARVGSYNSLARLARLGIEARFAVAAFADRRTLIADGSYVRFEKAIVATGAVSALPQFPGLRRRYVTSETIFDLTQLPGHLAVVGGGPLGCELAQAFCRLGSRVTIVQDEAKFLPREERVRRKFSRSQWRATASTTSTPRTQRTS